jgi:hypothetical protein
LQTVRMQNLSPRFPQPIFRPKHFSSATFQQSSTWRTEATIASLNYSIRRGVLDNQEFGNLMHARHNVINTNLKYSKHFKPLTGSSFGRDTSQKFGNPEIGDTKSAHQARFPSSPIDRSPNSVFSDYRQIRIIRTHQNSSESPNSVIRVTRITEYSVIRLFGSPQ